MSARRRRRRRGVALNGVLLVDKPTGRSSFDVIRRVQSASGAARVGHSGTLDPMATGLLPLCFGEATKAVPWLMDSRKRYEAVVALGRETNTDDREGEVTAERPVSPLDEATIVAALERFVGEIEQVPPAYSAIRRDGERLYERARRGETVDIPPRPVTVYELRLLARSDTELTLDVVCGKGFYVRALARDLGRELGCGAHLAALRRTATSGFSVENALTLDQLPEDASGWEPLLLTLEDALAHLPRLMLDEERSASVWNGRPIVVASQEIAGGDEDDIRLVSEERGLLAIGRVAQRDGDDVEIRVVRGFRFEAPATAPRAAIEKG